MFTKNSTIQGFVGGIIVSMLMMGCYFVWKEMVEAGNCSCIASAQSSYASILSRSEFRENIVLSENWYVLKETEAKSITDTSTGSKAFDCARFEYVKRGVNESGKPVEMMARKRDSFIEVRLLNIETHCKYL